MCKKVKKSAEDRKKEQRVAASVIAEYRLKGDDLEVFNDLIRLLGTEQYICREDEMLLDNPIAVEAAGEYCRRIERLKANHQK